MGCSDVPTAVFIETNLGTRLAVPASPDITADEFKREVERTHRNCFPEFGNITVEAVMVKQKLHCYHLSGSLPLKYAFMGSNVSWFLQTRVVLSDVPTHVESSKYSEAEVRNLNSSANVIADSVELGGFVRSSSEKTMKHTRKKAKVRRFPYPKASVLKISTASCFLKQRKRKNAKKAKMGHPRRGPKQRSLIENETLFCQSDTAAKVNWSEESDANVTTGATGETISEPESVSGIIKKYFSDYDEVASTTVRYHHRRQQLNCSTEREYLKMQLDIMSPATVHKPHQASHDAWVKKPGLVASREKHKGPEVGNRLLLASNSLRLTPSSRRSILSLCHHNDGESLSHKITATARNLAFEMADEYD